VISVRPGPEFKEIPPHARYPPLAITTKKAEKYQCAEGNWRFDTLLSTLVSDTECVQEFQQSGERGTRLRSFGYSVRSTTDKKRRSTSFRLLKSKRSKLFIHRNGEDLRSDVVPPTWLHGRANLKRPQVRWWTWWAQLQLQKFNGPDWTLWIDLRAEEESHRLCKKNCKTYTCGSRGCNSRFTEKKRLASFVLRKSISKTARSGQNVDSEPISNQTTSTNLRERRIYFDSTENEHYTVLVHLSGTNMSPVSNAQSKELRRNRLLFFIALDAHDIQPFS